MATFSTSTVLTEFAGNTNFSQGSITVNTGTDRLLLAWLYAPGDTGVLSQVLYNGVAMTALGSTTVAGNGDTLVHCYAIASPATGANTLRVEWTTGTAFKAYRVMTLQYNDCNPTTPYGTYFSATGTSATASSGTQSPGSGTAPTVAAGMYQHYSGGTVAASGTATSRQVGKYADRPWGISTRDDTGTITWSTGESGNWLVMGVPINGASGGGGVLLTNLERNTRGEFRGQR